MEEDLSSAALLLSTSPADYISKLMNNNYRTFKFISLAQKKVINVEDGVLMGVRTDELYKFTGINNGNLYCLLCPEIYYPECKNEKIPECTCKLISLNEFIHLMSKIQYFKLELYADIDSPLICSFDVRLPGDMYDLYRQVIKGVDCVYMNKENKWIKIPERGGRCDIKNCECEMELQSITGILNHASLIERAKGYLIVKVSSYQYEDMSTDIDSSEDTETSSVFSFDYDSDKATKSKRIQKDYSKTDVKNNVFFGTKWYKFYSTKDYKQFKCRRYCSPSDKTNKFDCRSIIKFKRKLFDAGQLKIVRFKAHHRNCTDSHSNIAIKEYINKQKSDNLNKKPVNQPISEQETNVDQIQSPVQQTDTDHNMVDCESNNQLSNNNYVDDHENNSVNEITMQNEETIRDIDVTCTCDKSVDKLKDKLTSMEVENNKLELMYHELNSELTKARIEIDNAKAQNEKLNDELNQLNRQLRQKDTQQLENLVTTSENNVPINCNQVKFQSTSQQQEIINLFDQLSQQSSAIQIQANQQLKQQVAFNRSIKLYNSNVQMILKMLKSDSPPIDNHHMVIRQILSSFSELEKKSLEKEQVMLQEIFKFKNDLQKSFSDMFE